MVPPGHLANMRLRRIQSKPNSTALFKGAHYPSAPALHVDKRRKRDYRAGRHGDSPVSRETLIEAYVSALPFVPVAVVAIPGGGCRVAVGGAIGGAAVALGTARLISRRPPLPRA